MTKRWFVKIPTYMDMWEEVRLWEIVALPADSREARHWSEGWTTNDLGERVPLPFQTFEFETYEDAHSFIEWHLEREQ